MPTGSLSLSLSVSLSLYQSFSLCLSYLSLSVSLCVSVFFSLSVLSQPVCLSQVPVLNIRGIIISRPQNMQVFCVL